jgi:Ca2+-binding RTX toxin-like protein
VTRPNVVTLKVAELTTASTVFAGNKGLFTTQVIRNPAVGLAELQIVHTVDGPGSFVAGGCATTPPGGQCNGAGASQTVVVDTVPQDVVLPASVKLEVACSARDGASIVETAEAVYEDLSRPQDRQASVGIKVANPAPVFTLVPPAVTITSCSAPDIGRATAQAGSPFCRTTPVTVTNDAPARFPLGKTIVTWTATDAAGQRTVAFQEVTAILGDDASCCPRGSNVIVGTPGSDVLIGTDGPDCILGLGGDDVLVGLGGNDVLSGGDGNDTLDGGDGDDILFGGRGLDILSGGPGGDQLWGGEGDDQLDGGDGNDALHGEAGSDQLNGGRGDDLLDGGPGVDSCTGGGGNDKFVSCAAATP